MDLEIHCMNYYKLDKEKEKLYPINPYKETKVTSFERNRRYIMFYDYNRIFREKQDEFTGDYYAKV